LDVKSTSNRRQCFALEPTAEVVSSRRNSASYCIIWRINCSTIDRGTRCIGQKRDLGDPSLALSDGCNGLRARSLKLASNRANRHTLKAAPAAAILATGETKKAAQRFSAIGR
jgi:hypothetical protein